MSILQDVPFHQNHLITLYKKAHELIRDLPADQHACIRLHLEPGANYQYNLPTVSTELAVILPGSGETAQDVHDIILHKRGGGLKCISELKPLYHSLHYDLLFP